MNSSSSAISKVPEATSGLVGMGVDVVVGAGGSPGCTASIDPVEPTLPKRKGAATIKRATMTRETVRNRRGMGVGSRRLPMRAWSRQSGRNGRRRGMYS